MSNVPDKNDALFLGCTAAGGGMLPACTVVRICNDGTVKCLVTNSWTHHDLSAEAGTYEMTLPKAEMDAFKTEVEHISLNQQETTYGQIYADSGTETLVIYRNNEAVSVKWGANSEDELPAKLQLLRKKLWALLAAAKAFPKQSLVCTLSPAAPGLVFTVKNRGCMMTELKDTIEGGTADAFVNCQLLPVTANLHNSGTFLQVYNSGTRLRFSTRLFSNPQNGPCYLQPGGTVSFSAVAQLAAFPREQFVLLGVARFAAVVHWDGAAMLTDFTCIISP